MSSSGGSKSFGVVVLVMESFVGSISRIFSPTDSSACMLYGLWVRHRSEALSGATGERKAQWDSEESNREEGRESIVRYAAQAERVGRGWVMEQVVGSRILLFWTTKPKLTAAWRHRSPYTTLRTVMPNHARAHGCENSERGQ